MKLERERFSPGPLPAHPRSERVTRITSLVPLTSGTLKPGHPPHQQPPEPPDAERLQAEGVPRPLSFGPGSGRGDVGGMLVACPPHSHTSVQAPAFGFSFSLPRKPQNRIQKVTNAGLTGVGRPLDRRDFNPPAPSRGARKTPSLHFRATGSHNTIANAHCGLC